MSSAAAERESDARPSILIVDDVPLFRHLAAGTFDAAGHWSLTGTVSNNPNVLGHTLTLRTYGLSGADGVLESSEADLILQ